MRYSLRYTLIRLVTLCLLIPAATGRAQVEATPELPKRELPKIVLMGDSIRLSYAESVRQALRDEAIVVNPKASGGDSSNVLSHLEAWVIREQPQIVHFNCGIHDTKKFKATGKYQVSPEQYESNLRSIVERIRAKTDAIVLFATTTPIVDERAAMVRSGRDYELLGASVEQYNEIARRVMRELDVPVNDLHAKITDCDPTGEEWIGSDGVHLSDSARPLVGQLVARFIQTHLRQEASSQPWKIDEWKKPPEFTWLDRESPIRSLTFRNEPFEGKPTEVFAFYATPGSIAGDPTRDRDLPAVVLIHGGGGTAFAEWVSLWAERGYAAIAMDLSGRQPAAPRFDPQSGKLIVTPKAARTRLEHGGPEADHVAKFQNAGGDVTDDWQYHAVAAVLRAHSLIRSFPEVDEERTAVTGISWGGYLTCLAASLDDRFQAAVPVYGCGFLHEGESVQKRLIDQLEPEKRREWIRIYDPSAWLPQCHVPILFVNGTNDQHYPLDSYVRSFRLVPGRKQIRIEPGMRHSHQHGWAPAEIGWFIDQHVRGGTPLPALGPVQVESDQASARITSSLPIEQAKLCYTTDTGPLLDRHWQSEKAALEDDTITATVPPDASIWMFTVTDSRGAMVSTPAQFAKE